MGGSVGPEACHLPAVLSPWRSSEGGMMGWMGWGCQRVGNCVLDNVDMMGNTPHKTANHHKHTEGRMAHINGWNEVSVMVSNTGSPCVWYYTHITLTSFQSLICVNSIPFQPLIWARPPKWRCVCVKRKCKSYDHVCVVSLCVYVCGALWKKRFVHELWSSVCMYEWMWTVESSEDCAVCVCAVCVCVDSSEELWSRCLARPNSALFILSSNSLY